MDLGLQQAAAPQGWSLLHKLLLVGVLVGAVAYWGQRRGSAQGAREPKSLA
jgi:hypothetical protein